MKKFIVRNYYRGDFNLEDIKITKFNIEYENIDEAYDKYIVPEIEGYVLLNWLISVPTNDVDRLIEQFK